jgi:hypothetical protein
MATLGLALGAQSASAFERHFWVETERGTISGSTDVYCFDGACYREAEITGVNGNALQTSGMCVRRAAGVWNCKGTVTGPNGGSVTRYGRVRVWID